MLVYIIYYTYIYIYIIVIVIGHKYIDTMDDTWYCFEWIDAVFPHIGTTVQNPCIGLSAFRYKLHHLGTTGATGQPGMSPHRFSMEIYGKI
jgi:hypothetical protein